MRSEIIFLFFKISIADIFRKKISFSKIVVFDESGGQITPQNAKKIISTGTQTRLDEW